MDDGATGRQQHRRRGRGNQLGLARRTARPGAHPGLAIERRSGRWVDGSHVYWANTDPGEIGRANLNGTGVNQRFVAKKDFRNLHGVAVNPGR